MKKFFLYSAILVIALFSTLLPAHADESGTIESQDQKPLQKDECLLTARRCGNSILSLQDKIERLKDEIAKGSKAYTPEELSNLQQQLNEVNKTLDFLLEK